MFYSKTCYVAITVLILNEQYVLSNRNSPKNDTTFANRSFPPTWSVCKQQSAWNTAGLASAVHRCPLLLKRERKLLREWVDPKFIVLNSHEEKEIYTKAKAGKVDRSFLRFVFGMLRGSFSLVKLSKFWKIALFGLGFVRDICGFRKQLKWDELY